MEKYTSLKKQMWVSVLVITVLTMHGLGVFTFPFLPAMRQALAEAETKWADTHLTGTATNPNNAIGALNNTWAGTTNTNTDWTSRWSMENPTGGITGTQTIEVWARKGSNSGNPTLGINLYENGSLVQSVLGSTSVTSATGQTLSGTFSGSVIANRDNVEIEVVVTGAGGSPSARNSVEIDSIEWTVNFERNITAATEGTQITPLYIDSPGSYIGGAFSFTRDTTSTNITQIIVTETGTINADTDLTNLQILYKAEVTCSSAIPGDATVFNGTGVGFSSSQATAGGTMSVSTSKVCVYVRVDIGAGASVGETIELQITNPSTQVTASVGTVSPATAVVIAGTSTLEVRPGPTTDQVMRGGNWFSGGTEQSHFWAD